MKITFFILTACLLLCFACSPKISNPKAASHQLKVLTYNIHHANPPSKKDVIDIDAIVHVIKTENPDLVAIQELDKLVPRSGMIDEAEMIARKTGMNYHFFKAIDYSNGEYGIGIFSKLPLKDPKQITLPKAIATAETRTLGYAELSLSSGQEIIFACTHLGVDSEASRVMQVKAIQSELGITNKPIILCGDLNAGKGSESIDLLLQQFRNACSDNCGFTIPAVNPRRNIDFILTKNADWQVTDYHVVNETYASDHRPVAATYDTQP